MQDITFICQEDIPSLPPAGALWDISVMPRPAQEPPNPALSSRLAVLLEGSEYSARSLSRAIGANVTYVGQLISGKGGTPSAARLQAIAERLGTTTDHLLGRSVSPEQPRSEVSFRDAPAPFRHAGADGIPVLGTAYCDDLAVESTDDGPFEVERVLLEADHTVRLVERPPALWAARDAYAIYLHGSSMEPRFYQGDLCVVDPRRPPSPGDDVVVQLTDGQGGSDVITVLVKQLLRSASAYVELRQFNPDRRFRIPRAQVARLHRICTRNELLGG